MRRMESWWVRAAWSAFLVVARMLPSLGSPDGGCIFPPIPHFDGLSFSGQGTMSCSSLCPQHLIGA